MNEFPAIWHLPGLLNGDQLNFRVQTGRILNDDFEVFAGIDHLKMSGINEKEFF